MSHDKDTGVTSRLSPGDRGHFGQLSGHTVTTIVGFIYPWWYVDLRRVQLIFSTVDEHQAERQALHATCYMLHASSASSFLINDRK